MRKILTLCSVMAILLLSACAPGGTQSTDAVTTESTTMSTESTTMSTESTTMSTDDTFWSDTTWSDDFTSVTESTQDDSDDGYYVPDFDSTTTEYKEVIPDHHEANLVDPQKGGSDAEAEALKQEILNTKEGDYNILGTTYYVSYKGDDNNDGLTPETAWRTPDAVTMNSYLFEEGDAVLFERGGIYRRCSPITVESGMTLGAYGEGEKPALYGSQENYAWGAKWLPSRMKYVWKLSLYTGDAGSMVFNHGEAVGDKKANGLEELVENGDFFHNQEENTLYLYLDKGYPNVVYNDIEIATAERVLTCPRNVHDVVVDNLAIKYSGYYGIDTKADSKNVSITNCEFGWIGGCFFIYSTDGTMLGNAIQFWESIENATVENCWIYQCYDTGISPQGISSSTYRNIILRNNLVEYCAYTIEFFDRETSAIWDNFVIEDNILRFSGYGFSRYRKDAPGAISHLVGWSWAYDHIDGIVIRNNIFDCSTKNLVYWYANGAARPVFEQGNVIISGNSFYQKANDANQAMMFSKEGQVFATNQQELEDAIRPFDSNPKVVKWLS